MKKLVILLTLVLSLTSCHRERQVQQILQKPRTECLVKTTPVKVYVKERAGADLDYGAAQVFGVGDKVVFGDWTELGPYLNDHADQDILAWLTSLDNKQGTIKRLIRDEICFCTCSVVTE